MSRFWSKVDKNSDGGCWQWTAGAVRGYGYYSVKGRSVKAHRISWEKHFGPIPEGMFVCHHCDNPGCVNPEHLFLGTPADNMLDKVAKGRASSLPGETNPQAKLTESHVREIRRLRSRGVKLESIAEKFGIDRRHASLIARRKSWAHVS